MTSPARNRVIVFIAVVLMAAVVGYFRRGSAPTVQVFRAVATAGPTGTVGDSAGVPDRSQGRFVQPRIRVPSEAVKQQDGRSVVWVIRNDRLEIRPVEAGPVTSGVRDVHTGLSGGELLLIGGVEAPKDGMRVRIATGIEIIEN